MVLALRAQRSKELIVPNTQCNSKSLSYPATLCLFICGTVPADIARRTLLLSSEYAEPCSLFHPMSQFHGNGNNPELAHGTNTCQAPMTDTRVTFGVFCMAKVEKSWLSLYLVL